MRERRFLRMRAYGKTVPGRIRRPFSTRLAIVLAAASAAVGLAVVPAVPAAAAVQPYAVGTIGSFFSPDGIALSADGKSAYVLTQNPPVDEYAVEAVDTATNTISASITASSFDHPVAIAANPVSGYVYVLNDTGAVSVISTAKNAVTAVIGTPNPDDTMYDPVPQAIAVSPNGATAYVSQGPLGIISVLNLTTDKVTRTITVSDDPSVLTPTTLALGPDGKTLYVALGGDGIPGNAEVAVIDTATGTVAGTITGLAEETYFGSLAVSPDGKALYVTTTAGVDVFSTAVGTTAATTSVAIESDVTYPPAVLSPDGSSLYVGGGSSVSVVSTASDAVTTIPISPGVAGNQNWQATELAITPNGGAVYVAAADGAGAVGAVAVIDTATGTVSADVPSIGYAPVALAVSPNGAELYVANNDAGDAGNSDDVTVVSTASGRATADIAIPSAGGPDGVLVSPSGKTLYVSDNGGPDPTTYGDTVWVVNTATRAVTGSITVGTQPGAMAISPNGSTLYVANSLSGTVSVVDTAADQAVNTFNVGSGPDSLAISPNGATLYVGVIGGLSVVNTATGTVTKPITDLGAYPALALSHNGATLYASGSLISTKTYKVTGYNPDLCGIGNVLSPNGATLYDNCGAYGTVQVINAVTNAVTETIRNPAFDEFEGMAVSPVSGAIYVADTAADSVHVMTPVKEAPKFSSAAKATFVYHKKASFTIRTTGWPVVAAISESGVLPKGLTFKNNKNGTATISGTPSVRANKTYTLTLRASNGVSPTAKQTFKLVLKK
jgi:YVTN family beta-propeller protein